MEASGSAVPDKPAAHCWMSLSLELRTLASEAEELGARTSGIFRFKLGGGWGGSSIGSVSESGASKAFFESAGESAIFEEVDLTMMSGDTAAGFLLAW